MTCPSHHRASPSFPSHFHRHRYHRRCAFHHRRLFLNSRATTSVAPDPLDPLRSRFDPFGPHTTHFLPFLASLFPFSSFLPYFFSSLFSLSSPYCFIDARRPSLVKGRVLLQKRIRTHGILSCRYPRYRVTSTLEAKTKKQETRQQDKAAWIITKGDNALPI